MKKLFMGAALLAGLFTLLASSVEAQQTDITEEIRKLQDAGQLPPTHPDLSDDEKKSRSDAWKEELDKAAGKVNCFDYYKFQSVQVNLGTDKDEYLPGETVVFKGELVNQNNYPVVDGNVFVRIGRVNPNYTNEGQFTIDELVPLEKIVLAPQQKKQTELEWKVPMGLAKGEYRADFFFSVGKKFNLGGLPFSNEVVINSVDFGVTADNQDYISFDKSQTKVNGESYRHIGALPVIEPGNGVKITQPIKNTYSDNKKVTVTYDLYFWDSLNQKDKVDSRKEDITIPAQGSKELVYTVPVMNDSVYYLKITAVSDTEKSIINIRLASDQSHPRLNYPGINKFPLLPGDEAVLFSCFHNTAPLNSDGQVNVRLTDKAGKTVGALNYNGEITGAMMAAKADLKIQANYDWLKLSATLTDKNGKVVDSYETVYDCQAVNSAECQAAINNKEEGASQSKVDKFIAWGVFALLAIIMLVILIVKHRRTKSTDLMIFCLVGLGCLFAFSPIQAYNQKSATVSTNYSCASDPGNAENCQWLYTLDLWDIHVNHRVDMTQGNYTVNVDDPISFLYNPEKPFFDGAGTTGDTPYGNWCSGDRYTMSWNLLNEFLWDYDLSTEPDTRSSDPNWCYTDWLNIQCVQFCNGFAADGVSVTAEKPPVEMVSSNPGVISCSGMNCQAVSPGTATVRANIGNTPATIWHYWYAAGGSWIPFGGGALKDLTLPSANLSWDISVVGAGNQLTVTKNGTGDGTVTSNDGGICCGPMCAGSSVCSSNYANNTVVTLTALPDSNSAFGGWSAECSPWPTDAGRCDVTMDVAKTVNAIFHAKPTLNLTANSAESAIIDYNDSATLQWVSTNATRCVASNGWSGNKTVPSGAESTGPLTDTTFYDMQCWNDTNGLSTPVDSVTVNVGACTPTYTYSCSYNPTSNICDESTCQQTITTSEARCIGNINNGCPGAPIEGNMSNCGASCQDATVTCPPCRYIEVNP